MTTAAKRNRESLPVGDLGIIALLPQLEGYARDNYLIRTENPRFGSGEGKGIIYDSIRGEDLYILIDVCNYSLTYKMRGKTNHMSPDDHFLDLERMISAIGGKARRINIIMPYLYESRQTGRNGRESLDCAQALKDLVQMGVENIITFDAHEPRIQNAIPLSGFENFRPIYQFIKGLYRACPTFDVSPDRLLIVSPDEGGASRAIYMANVLGVDMGMFYKRRDYTTTVNGQHPIVAHEFLGADVAGKDVVIIDDMISSGEGVIEIAKQLKKRKAERIFICATFGLFTDGLEKFDKAYKKGLFNAILTTNLTYQKPGLEWYQSCDLSKFIALIIDTLNHDGSLSELLNPVDRINKFLAKKGVVRATDAETSV